jgi:hypothetical protein
MHEAFFVISLYNNGSNCVFVVTSKEYKIVHHKIITKSPSVGWQILPKPNLSKPLDERNAFAIL